MSGKFKTIWFWSPLKSIDDSRKGTSPIIDYEHYAISLKNAYEELDLAGYDVVNIVPIAMKESHNGAECVDSIISVTRGAIIVGKKRIYLIK
ncbi:hypothetical protein [Shewanella putrefaciens]|uniref:hypothetical protein n=1 Tax=Shewanella putrefaciens TaxID=24 RepID=UPI003D79D0E6